MTRAELYTLIADELNPHQFADETLMMWTDELENEISSYIEFNYVTEEEDEPTEPTEPDINDDLLIDEPSLYIEFLSNKIDLANREYDSANNHAVMFNSLYNNWREKYFRENKATLRPFPYIRGL